MLDIEGVSLRYGTVQVIWDVSLSLEEGEAVALVGANAAGKTSLIRMISGLVRPSGGRIALFGEDISGRDPADIVRMGLSHVPQGRFLFPHLTVRENIEMGAAYLPGAWQAMDRTMAWVIHLFPRLGERLGQKAGTLSGGEQQMLAIARALMARPKILLVDEPCLGLAPIMVKVVFDALGEIKKQGITLLLVEQNVWKSLKFSERGYVMENGRIVHRGASAELLADGKIRKAYLGL
ncbi:MAG: ABC transporter ATP-binding protein [Peptococcaceae bacterium]|nr:ABC transporter ATP-binding protein [Peptococcaceae bacterium]